MFLMSHYKYETIPHIYREKRGKEGETEGGGEVRLITVVTYGNGVWLQRARLTCMYNIPMTGVMRKMIIPLSGSGNPNSCM